MRELAISTVLALLAVMYIALYLALAPELTALAQSWR